MNNEFITSKLIEWYKINKRDLPWRNTKNPYFIWLSEIILQQTRVNQGLPYYIKFTESFPDIKSLAKAPEQKVLSLWQGLGYYSRARNLHASAKLLLSENKGLMPDNYENLLKIKGIGPYTAAAISSFAFKQKVPVLDGNVFRVLSRIFGVETDISSNKGTKEFNELAWMLIPDKDPDEFNQAIMEFGALQCTPSNPSCGDCPLSIVCVAFKNDLQGELPVKIKKLKKKTRYFNYLCIRHGNNYIFKERKERDIWQGLFEFPMVESNQILQVQDLLKDLKKSKFIIENESKTYKHILTHQTLFAKFWIIEIVDQNYFNKCIIDNNSSKFSLKKVKILPKSVLINKFLGDYIFV